MEFRLLGPLEVIDHGEPLKLGGSRQRALLALLLLHANEAMTLDQLVDELWAESRPKTAEQIVRIYVSQLRKLLEAERSPGEEPQVLVTHEAGYELRLQPEQLDIHRFERLLDEGRRRLEAEDPTALGFFRGALALWHGPPLVDFTYEAFAQAEIARLEDLRLNALQDRIDADLARGAHTEVVPELEALVDRHPLRERLRAQLMLALYRSGRQAEALAAYQAARTFLREELGIEPGTALKELEGMILRQDASLEPVATTGVPPEPNLEHVVREVRKPVTVVNAEIGDATGRNGTVDPEARRRAQGHFIDAVERVLAHYGGSVGNWTDGAVTALFGTPVAHEDDALRAVRAAAEIRGALGGDSHCRIGIDTGEVIASESGTGHPAVSGQVVAQAAALNRSAAWGEILVGEMTWRLVRDTLQLEAAEREDTDLAAWCLVSLETSGRRLKLEAPTIGRERELSELRHAFTRTVDERTSYVFTLLGDPGVGKSRIVREVISALGGEAATLIGRCLSYGEGITFRPLTEMVEQAAGGTAQADLLAILDGEPDAERVAAQLASLTGAGEIDAAGDEVIWAFRRLVETLAREHPLLLVFEDLHWAESTLLDLVEHLSGAHDAPVLMLCTARPELLEKRPTWGGGKINASTLLLTPLRDEDARALLGELGVSAPNEMRNRVIETSEGNPLFVEQLAAMLLETPLQAGELPVPPTIQAVLAARLDRLGPGERAVLESAAVIGREFSTASVIDLLPNEARESAARHLDTLVRKGFVRASSAEGTFRFAHVLIQDAAYRAIPKERRAQLHEIFADWLAQESARRITEQDEVLGYHLEQACRYRADVGLHDERTHQLVERAAAHLGAAGRRAVSRGDFPAADNLLSRATKLLPLDDKDRLELLPTLGRVLVTTGSLRRAASVLDDACRRLASAAMPAAHAHALVERGNLRFWQGRRLEESARDAEAALAVFSDLGDEPGLAKAWELIARHRRHRGSVLHHLDAVERALQHARLAGDRSREGDARHNICLSLIDGPAPFDEILRYAKSFAEWAAATGDPLREADATGPLTYLLAMQGRYDEARELIANTTRELDDHGDRIGLWSCAIMNGRIEMLAGNPAAAERFFRSAQEFETGQLAYLSWGAVRLARSLLAQGNDEALSVLETARTELWEDSEPFLAMWHGTRARALAREGDLQAALVEAQEAEQVAEGTGYLLRIAKAHFDRAEVLSVASQPAEARGSAEEALRLFEHKGDLASAGRVQHFIAGLS